MSQPSHTEHGHGDDGNPPVHFATSGYLVGFALSVILTVIPFWLVMDKEIASASTTALVLLTFAFVQMCVHVVYFLHMNTKSEGGWNMLALIFTIVLLVILLAGSAWVMHNMNVNMMPMPAAHGMG